MFSKTQEEAIIYFKLGYNMLISGPGGSGKSYLIKYLNLLGETLNKKIQVCALTGCAALLLNCHAKTLHSWAGIGLGTEDKPKIISKIKKNKYLVKRWRKIDCLIIDEVSMMSKKLFDLLDEIGQEIRMNNKPWGGIQLILSGDFYQLSPVGDKEEEDSSKFCFESENWNKTIQKSFILDKIFRQEDNSFINLLDDIRQGKFNKEDLNLIKQCLLKNSKDLEIKPIKLYPTKNKVNKLNKIELDKLESKEELFECKFNLSKKSKYSDEEIEREKKYLLKNSLFDEKLILKKGCQVMCISNLDLNKGICNGSTGKVIDFIDGKPKVKFYNNQEIVIESQVWKSEKIPELSVEQVPLILAWAVTIHKSQGATLDIAEIDVGNSVFTTGQTYVALSRVKNLEGLYLKSFNENKIKVDSKVTKFYNNVE